MGNFLWKFFLKIFFFLLKTKTKTKQLSHQLMALNLRNTSSRRWCFTINNPTHLDENRLHQLRQHSSYLVYQKEQGANETIHYQGYVEFTNRKKGTTVYNLVQGHLSVARGTPKQASEYCKKEESRIEGPWEYGILTEVQQGTRTDLTAIKEAIDQGKSLTKVAEDHFSDFVRYEKGFRSYINMTDSPRSTKTEVVVLTGFTGSGKSYLANYGFPTPYVVPEATSSQFFDGYDPRENQTVILDDFNGNIKFHTMLKLMDAYPYRVNTKGGMVNWKPRYLVITSNKEPDFWYIKKSLDSDLWPAFERRIDYKIKFLKNRNVVTYSNVGALPTAFKKILLDRFTLVEEILVNVNEKLMNDQAVLIQ